MRFIAFAITLMLLGISAASVARADAEQAQDVSAPALAQTYARIKPSLALIAVRQGKNDFITGSAFCISNYGGKSYYLTNAHVVGQSLLVAVLPQWHSGNAHVGHVIRVNTSLDAAIVEIDVGDVPKATLGDDILAEGHQIAIAGFPSAHVDFALLGLGLTPSVHEGIINAYPGNGAFMEFDAQVEHGNSGGPVFDPDTGVVYGVVTLKVGSDQTNLGIPIALLHDFIANAGILVERTTRTQALANATTNSEPTAAPVRAYGSETFPTYIPLRDRQQLYNCGNGIHYLMKLRHYGAADEYMVMYSWFGLKNPPPLTSNLQAHDDAGNIVLMGTFDAGGSLDRYATGQLAVPLQPTPGFSVTLEFIPGKPSVRTWVGSSSLYPIWTDEFGSAHNERLQVQVYEDPGTQYDQVAAYANQIGLVGWVLYNKQNSPVIGCVLERIASLSTPLP